MPEVVPGARTAVLDDFGGHVGSAPTDVELWRHLSSTHHAMACGTSCPRRDISFMREFTLRRSLDHHPGQGPSHLADDLTNGVRCPDHDRHISAPVLSRPGAFGASSYQDSSGEHFVIAGTSIIVEFSVEGSRHIIGWTGGCNSLGTAYSISDGRLHLDNDIGSTTVLGDQGLMDQDDLLSRVLRGDPEVAISATSLRIDDSHTTITFAPATKSAYDPQ
jgi:heat shock protein HslJ